MGDGFNTTRFATTANQLTEDVGTATGGFDKSLLSASIDEPANT